MLNLLRSDLYRLVRQLQFWVLAGIAVVLCVLVAALLAWVASPDFADYVNRQASEQMAEPISEAERAEIATETREAMDDSSTLNGKVLPSLTHTWAQTFLTGGALGIIGSMVVVLLLVADFKGGFIRSLVMDRRGRLVYYAEKLVLVGIVQAIFVAVFAVATVASFAAYGFTYEAPDPIADAVLWLALTWLVACAYALIAACVIWLTRSEWAGAACAVVVSAGIAGALVASVAELLAARAPWLMDAPYLMLYGCVHLLGEGASPLLQAGRAVPLLGLPPVGAILVVTFAYIAICVAVTLGVCRKKDI